MRRAKPTRFLTYILLLILSGVGNIFALIIPNMNYFNRSIITSKEYMKTFYDDDMRKYISDIGFFDQAEKCGMIPSEGKIREFIEKRSEFLENNTFA